MRKTAVFLSLIILGLNCFCSPAAARCTFDGLQYDENGQFVSAQIYRNQNKIGSINRPRGLDAYYVQCSGVDPQKAFTSPNHAAWAACIYCK